MFLGHSLQEVRTEVTDHVIKFTNCHWFRPILEAVLLAGRVLVETFFAQLQAAFCSQVHDLAFLISDDSYSAHKSCLHEISAPPRRHGFPRPIVACCQCLCCPFDITMIITSLFTMSSTRANDINSSYTYFSPLLNLFI